MVSRFVALSDYALCLLYSSVVATSRKLVAKLTLNRDI